MGAIRGKGDQFVALANHKKAQVTEASIQSVGGIFAEQACIYQFFRVVSAAALWIGDCGTSSGQEEELTPVHARGYLFSFVDFHVLASNTRTPDW
jgi:hypothetical protein